MVLTRLILNDMIKVKDSISEIVLLLEPTSATTVISGLKHAVWILFDQSLVVFMNLQTILDAITSDKVGFSVIHLLRDDPTLNSVILENNVSCLHNIFVGFCCGFGICCRCVLFLCCFVLFLLFGFSARNFPRQRFHQAYLCDE